MVTTYQAMLKGGRLDWGEEGPPRILLNMQVPVQLTILQGRGEDQSDGVAMAAALERIAATTQAASYGDGSTWQNDTRRDRSLHERDE